MKGYIRFVKFSVLLTDCTKIPTFSFNFENSASVTNAQSGLRMVHCDPRARRSVCDQPGLSSIHVQNVLLQMLLDFVNAWNLILQAAQIPHTCKCHFTAEIELNYHKILDRYIRVWHLRVLLQ